LETVKKFVNEGVTISTVGFGMGSYNDILMERLADDGNGNYAYDVAEFVDLATQAASIAANQSPWPVLTRHRAISVSFVYCSTVGIPPCETPMLYRPAIEADLWQIISVSLVCLKQIKIRPSP
jgi:hypothetical protein